MIIVYNRGKSITEGIEKMIDTEWKVISKKSWDWYLGCVPPYKMVVGAFMVGERYGYYESDVTVMVCVQVIDKFYSKIVTMSSWNPAIYTSEIIQQFNIDIHSHTREFLKDK
jgi:hypothetical protein